MAIRAVRSLIGSGHSLLDLVGVDHVDAAVAGRGGCHTAVTFGADILAVDPHGEALPVSGRAQAGMRASTRRNRKVHALVLTQRRTEQGPYAGGRARAAPGRFGGNKQAALLCYHRGRFAPRLECGIMVTGTTAALR